MVDMYMRIIHSKMGVIEHFKAFMELSMKRRIKQLLTEKNIQYLQS